MDRDTAVRLELYRRFVEDRRAPTHLEVGEALGLSEEESAEAFRRLADSHVIVLRPGTLEVWMANPLSAVETPYRVETPQHWNGTLILFSHGYVPAGVPIPPGIPLANRADTEQWLLDHGYALAGSDFRGRTGLVVKEALEDQIALLDWFDATIGKPRRTIASGFSMGGGIATRLAERNPGRFDGVLAISGAQDMQATMNRGLDVTFAVRTLLTDDQRLQLRCEPAVPRFEPTGHSRSYLLA